jgi:hypothetical protein
MPVIVDVVRVAIIILDSTVLELFSLVRLFPQARYVVAHIVTIIGTQATVEIALAVRTDFLHVHQSHLLGIDLDCIRLDEYSWRLHGFDDWEGSFTNWTETFGARPNHMNSLWISSSRTS